MQLLLLLYDPRPFVPTRRDAAAGDRIVAALQALPGPVWVMDHNYWPTVAGLEEHADGWAVNNVVWSDRRKAGSALEEEIRSAIAQRRFGAIVMDGGRAWFQADVEANYTGAGPLTEGEGYRPRSGAPRRPAQVFVRRP